MTKEFFRDITVRAYDEETIKKIDELRASGVNITEFVLNTIMKADIEKLTERN